MYNVILDCPPRAVDIWFLGFVNWILQILAFLLVYTKIWVLEILIPTVKASSFVNTFSNKSCDFCEMRISAAANHKLMLSDIQSYIDWKLNWYTFTQNSSVKVLFIHVFWHSYIVNELYLIYLLQNNSQIKMLFVQHWLSPCNWWWCIDLSWFE